MVELGNRRIGLGVTLALVVGGCLLQILLVPHDLEGGGPGVPGEPPDIREAMPPRVASAIAPPSALRVRDPIPSVAQKDHAASGPVSIADPQDQASPPAAGTLEVMGPSEAIVGDLVTFSVVALDTRDAVYAPLVLNHDPEVLGYVSAEEGSLFSSDGAETQFIAAPSPVSGQVEIAVARVPPSAGIEGGGVLASATFLVLAAGESRIGVEGSRLIDPTGREITFESEDAILRARRSGSRIKGQLE